MSEEAFRILKNMNLDEMKTRIAFHCAPLLAAVKMSNLLTVPIAQKENILTIFEHTDISCYILWESEDKVAFLLYVKDRMEDCLKKEDVNNMMERLGYRNLELDKVLERVSERYTNHMDKECCFPHEIGLLLGYPAGDVAGFMENHGKNFLCAGYWKVYENLAEAIRTFRTYDIAQAVVMDMVRQGINIREILEVCRRRQFG